MNGQEKITVSHLERTAFVYVRQSTLAQVRVNNGSTERQYDQLELAQEFGWHESLIEVIDEDLGKSGTSSDNRSGFQRLAADVAMGKAGAVFGIEVSRLCRSNADWYRLLDLCSARDTLVIDGGRVHDPTIHDDRLLLGLKGTMADSETWLILSRLHGGRYKKALHGEYRFRAPIGYVYGDDWRLVRDPDEQVSRAVDQFFKRFEELGVAERVVRDYWERGIEFPRRPPSASESHRVEWVTLSRTRAIYLLHNPIYAGAYSYGRAREKKPRWAGPGPWPVLLKDHTDAYISWKQFMKNKERLKQNRSTSITSGSPRRGQALLQGIVYCGNCGRRMRVEYQGKDGRYNIHYQCRVAQENTIRRVCLSITGKPVDTAITDLCLKALNRENVEQALEISQAVEERHQEEAKEWQLKIERAEYEAQRAFRQYDAVDPENRLVARTLERNWEAKLEEVQRLNAEYEIWRNENQSPVSEGERQRLFELLSDFRQVWNSPTTSQADRKALIRLIIKDVTLRREGNEINIGIRWQSGKLETLQTSKGNDPNRSMLPAVVERIRALTDDHLDAEIAEILNEEGFLSVRNKRFTANLVQTIRQHHGIKKGHVGEENFYRVRELASRIGVSKTTIIRWCEEGLLRGKHQGKYGIYWIEASEEEIDRLARRSRTRRKSR